MRQTCQRIGVVAAAVVLLGCDGPTDPSPPDPPDPRPPVGNTWTTPAIRGLVRETNGGPIPGAGIRIGEWNRFVAVESDQAGVFTLAAGAVECANDSTSVLVGSRGFYFKGDNHNRVTCTRLLNPPPVEVTVKGERVLTAQVGAAIETTLSNDDFDWTNPADPNDFPCGPCRHVLLDLPRGSTTQLRVDWSGSAPLRVWLSGDIDWDLTRRLGEFDPLPGESAITVTIPSEWQGFAPFIKIGLPYGHRHPVGLAAPVAVRVQLRVVSQ